MIFCGDKVIPSMSNTCFLPLIKSETSTFSKLSPAGRGGSSMPCHVYFFSPPANPNFAKQSKVLVNSLANYFMLLNLLRKKELVWVPLNDLSCLKESVQYLTQIVYPKRKFPETWTVKILEFQTDCYFHKTNTVYMNNHFCLINSYSWNEASQKYHPSESVSRTDLINYLLCTGHLVSLFRFTF